MRRRITVLMVARLVISLGGFGLALALRVASWRLVLEEGRVVFVGNDAYYHARRILYALAHLPEVLQRDAYLRFPNGGEPIWPPLLDLAAALLVRACGAGAEAASAERVLVWLPPLLGEGE